MRRSLTVVGFLLLTYAFPALAWFNPGGGASEPVLGLTETTHGRIIAGGQFTAFDDRPRGGVARLTHDGALESSLADATGTVHVAVALPDGRALVGGSFEAIGGYARRGLARLDAAGTVDPAFDAQLVGGVFSIALQNDGKIVIGGHFSHVRGVARSSIARLNPDGTLDETFNPGWGVDGLVFSVAVQQNGKILIGGLFNWVDGKPFARIARLDSRGLVDPAFHPDADNIVMAVAEDWRGRILVGGYFTSIAGAPRRHLARLLADGTIDPAFVNDTDAPVLRIARNAYHFFIGGEFTTVAGAPFPYVARLDSYYGGPDPTFAANVNGPVRALYPSDEGKLLVGGSFSLAGGQPNRNVARLRSDGSVEPRVPDFDPGVFGQVRNIALERDGSWLVSGYFFMVGGVRRSYLARVRPDGSVDPGFDPAPNNQVYVMVPQPDGRILVGGGYTRIGGLASPGLTRLHANGTVDTSFAPALAGNVHAIAVQSDGKIVVGGQFSVGQSWEGRRNIARFHPDGTLDDTFKPTTDQPVYCVVALPDGKILIGGSFGFVNTYYARKGFAKLQSNGWPDWGFDARLDNGPYTAFVRTMAVQPDGKILITGAFTKVGDVARTNLARLHAGGTYDSSFSEEAQLTTEITAIVVQPDGKILVAGSFATPRVGLARFESDGRLDTAFDARVVQTNYGARVFAVARFEDGSLAIGGEFASAGGAPRSHIARLAPDGSAQ